MSTYWRDKVNMIDGMPIQNEHIYHVVTIGGGLTGVLTTYFFDRVKDKDGEQEYVILCCRDKFASGQTEGSLGIVSCLPGMLCTEMVKQLGRRKAGKYMKLCKSAVNDFEQIISSKNIECGFSRLPMYVYSMEEENNLEKEAKLAKSMKLEAECTRDTGLPFAVVNAVRFDNQAQMNIIEFMNGISEGIEMYEDAHITFDKKFILQLYVNDEQERKDGRFSVHTIFATNKLPDEFKGSKYDILEEVRYAVMVLSGCKPLNAIYHCIDKDGITMRSDGENLLMQIEVDSEDVDGSIAHGKLREFAGKYFTEGQETHFWVSTGHSTPSGIPFIEQQMVEAYWCSAFGTARGGPVLSMVAAKTLYSIVNKRRDPAKKLLAKYKIHLKK